LTGEYVNSEASLGVYLGDVEAALADIERRDVVGRLWRKDYTVWKPDPTEISDRLGWLTVTDFMSEQVPELSAFAREVQDAGFSSAVLLGMGGSSLGSEVLRQSLGSARGYPELTVLDSTVPAVVLAVIGDPNRFRGRGQVIRLAGLDLNAKRSGKRSQSAVPVISKCGNADLRYALNQAAQIARGTMPAGLERLVKSALNPELPWFVLLRDFVETSARNDYSWRRPNPSYLQRSQDRMPQSVLR